jgi:hypothetical protein
MIGSGKQLLQTFLRTEAVAALWAGAAFIPCASADQPDLAGGPSKEQVTLSAGPIRPGDLISDNEKGVRLHPARSGAVPAQGPMLSLSRIKSLLAAQSTMARTAVSDTCRSDNLRSLVGTDNGRVDSRILFNRTNGTPRLIKILDRSGAERSNGLTRQGLRVDRA